MENEPEPEPFVPMEVDEYDAASIPEDTETTTSSTGGANRRPNDPAYHRYKIGGPRSKKVIEFYDSTYVRGATIRYATTGFYTSGHKVGSKDEDLYFKVVDTTHPPRNGVHLPCFLYYESPEQWEKHFGVSCSEEVKNNWREKYHRAIYNRGEGTKVSASLIH